MSDKQLTITYEDVGAAPVKITVKRATALVGMQRFQYLVEGDDANKADDEAGKLNKAMAALRVVSFPDLVSCTIAAEGIPWPLTVEQFAELDEELINRWSEAVYTVNPQWAAKRPEPEGGGTTAKKAPS